MEKYAEWSQQLVQLLQLNQPPIAISFSSEAPKNVEAVREQVPAGCRFWQDAATATFSTTSADHELCAIGVHTHNLQTSPAQQRDLMDALKVFADLGYVRPEDVPQIPVLQHQPHYIIYSPLSESPLAPDVILLFVRPDQTLVLSEAAQQIERDNAPAMGRPACAVIPQVMNSGRPALSLGCCGARAYLDSFSEELAVFAIPGIKIEVYVERIAVLVNANNTLSKFHQLRAQDILTGKRPTVAESLAAFAAQS